MNRTSELKVRKIWENTNSTKDQVTVQFVQQTEGSAANNLLINAAQGTDFGPSSITALLSFKSDKAQEYFGTTEADYSDLSIEEMPSAAAFATAVGEELAISIEENVTQDPNRPTQAPKINPQTGEVLLVDGNPIYRHTQVAVVSAVKTVLLKHNGTAPAEAFETIDAVDAFAVAGASTVEGD